MTQHSDRTSIIALLGLAFAFIVVGALVNDATYSTLFDENNLVETLTALMYGLATVVSIGGALIEAGRHGVTRQAVSLFALGGFAAFLMAEEVSIWTVFMSSEPPRVLGIRMDAAHDLLHLGLKALKLLLAASLPLGIAFVTAIIALSGLAGLRFRNQIVDALRSALSSRSMKFILLCVVLGMTALVADLRSETWPILKSVEESLELTASLSLVAAAWIACSGKAHDRQELASHSS